MEDAEIRKAIETLLFITDHPISITKIAQAVGVKKQEKVEGFVRDIQREYADRNTALQVLEIAEGFQMATRSENARFVRNLYKDKMTMRLSSAALETLAIIAYKQPLSRADIETIRGVEVIAALETLLEKGLVKVVGRKETVGRPLLYGTTQDFLRHFGLRGVEDLPPIQSFEAASSGEAAPAETEPGAESETDGSGGVSESDPEADGGDPEAVQEASSEQEGVADDAQAAADPEAEPGGAEPTDPTPEALAEGSEKDEELSSASSSEDA